MPRYEKGTLGKLVVQDWDVVSSWSDVPLLFILTRQQAAALVSLAETLTWLTRWKNAPDPDTIDAFASETLFNLMNPITCEMLNACLAPAFAALTDQLEALQAAVDEVQQTQENNATAERELSQSTVENELCGGATGVVEAMDATNRQTYAETEAGVVDNVFELVQRFLSAIPIFGSLPFDELFGLVNWMFENQVAEYGVDYDLIKDQMICDLKCFVQANDNEFTWDVWADWLDHVGMAYPTNRAAGLFSRFSPTRQTWINQIAAQLNHDASLEAYFDGLAVAWEGGLLNPTVCEDCNCPDLTLSVYNDYGRTVLKYEIPVSYGVPFDVEVDPSTWGSNEFYAVWSEYVDYAYTVEEGTYTPTIGEEPWSYLNEANVDVGGDPGDPATDLPTPGTARGIFMNAREDDSSTHVVRITLTEP